MLDRALANPVARILELRDSLGLNEEQVSALRPLADSLQATNDAIRTAVQRQMQAGRAGADPGEGFRALQPQLQWARTARQEALEAAQRVLTPEQWERVPEEIRNPPQPQPGDGRMRRPQE